MMQNGTHEMSIKFLNTESTQDNSVPKLEGQRGRTWSDGQRGTLFSTSILLASSGMGAGMLTLPIAVQQAGPVVGVVLFFGGFLISALSTFVLLIGSSRLQAKTFGMLIDRSLGFQRKIFGLPLMDSFACVYFLMINVSNLIFIGDFLPALALQIPGCEWLNRAIAIGMAAAIIGALTALNSVHLVRHLASCGTFAIFFTVIVVLAEARFRVRDQEEIIAQQWYGPVEFTWSTLQSSGNVVMAFCIGPNVPGIAMEFKEPTVVRSSAAALLSLLFMLVCYAAFGFGGYFSFISHGLNPDILTNYPLNDPWVTACRAMLTVTLISMAVLCYIPAMKSFYIIMAKSQHQELEGEDYEPSFFVRIVAVGTISFALACTAFFIPRVNTFVSWIGALFSSANILYGPLVLISHGHVGHFSKRTRAAIHVTIQILMVYFWVAAITDCVPH